MTLDLTKLVASTEKTTSAEESAKNLLADLKRRLDEAIAALATAGNSPEELQQLQDLSDALGSNADSLSAAVVANTPAA